MEEVLIIYWLHSAAAVLMAEDKQTRVYVHPGLLHSRLREKVCIMLEALQYMAGGLA